MSSEPEATITVANNRIFVRSHYRHKERLKAIDGARWDGDARAWTYRADAEHAEDIATALRGIGIVRLSADFKALRENVAAPIAKVVVPTNFTGPLPTTQLWQHQRNAIEMALPHQGFYLAHDMGAGKTLSAIAIGLRRAVYPWLILAPKRVVSSWKEQMEMHAGDLLVPVALDKGTAAKRAETAKAFMQEYGQVAIIINYEAAISKVFKEWSLKQKWGLVILDEAHRIKAPGGVISKYCATLSRRAQYRLCLSGTPFAHGPQDIYGQFRFLAPEIFGTSYTKFKVLYTVPNPYMPDQIVDYQNLDDLQGKFYSIADRVMTRDVVDLPDERDIAMEGEMSSAAWQHYRELERDFYTSLSRSDDESDDGVTIQNILTKLLRLQQLTGGYLRDDDGVDHEIDTTKAELLADVLEGIPQDEPVVVFAKFRHDLDTIRRVATDAGRTCGELSGRIDDYQRWRDGAINTIAIQLQAGGEGLNALVSARYCVYFSVGYSLKDYNQSRARIIRPGQTRNVTFYHLICKGTIDETIYKSLIEKEEVIDSILKR